MPHCPSSHPSSHLQVYQLLHALLDDLGRGTVVGAQRLEGGPPVVRLAVVVVQRGVDLLLQLVYGGLQGRGAGHVSMWL